MYFWQLVLSWPHLQLGDLPKREFPDLIVKDHQSQASETGFYLLAVGPL
jgi:hypothetical protein